MCTAFRVYSCFLVDNCIFKTVSNLTIPNILPLPPPELEPLWYPTYIGYIKSINIEQQYWYNI